METFERNEAGLIRRLDAAAKPHFRAPPIAAKRDLSLQRVRQILDFMSVLLA
jgi:hypothetical protein